MARWMTPVAAAMLAVLHACDSGTHYSLRDTEQGAYRTSCWSGRCREEVSAPTTARPEPACTNGEHAGFALGGAYVVSACHACFSADGRVTRHDLSRCRAITCENARDCPPWHRGHAVECREGLCVEKDQGRGERPLDRVSSAALCMAGAGLASNERIPLAQDRLAFAQRACDAQGRCAQPSGCRPAPR